MLGSYEDSYGLLERRRALGGAKRLECVRIPPLLFVAMNIETRDKAAGYARTPNASRIRLRLCRAALADVGEI